MPKILTAKEIIKILLENGFYKKRQTGSHLVFRKDQYVVIVPFHGSKDIPNPVLKSIIKQSNLDKNLFI